MRALGVHCTPRDVYLALAEDGEVVDGGRETERLRLPAGEASEALSVFLDDTIQRLRILRLDAVVVLSPEAGRPGLSRRQGAVVERAVLETLMRIAAVRAAVPVEVLARPTLRSRLGCSARGNLTSHVEELVPRPVGRYWAEGRGLAALAALAARAA